jgi:iron-sulfur cluster assembly accessory protein
VRRNRRHKRGVATREHAATLRIGMITITENAAHKIQALLAEEPESDVNVLRVAIQGGGCSGFQYALGFDRGPQDGDNEIEMHGVKVVVDPFSAPYLSGSEIDYVDALMGAGFAINNPNVQAACGCGSSFQAKEGAVEGEAAGATTHAGGACGSGCSH